MFGGVRPRLGRVAIAAVLAASLGFGTISAPTAAAAGTPTPPAAAPTKPAGSTGSAKPAAKAAPQPADLHRMASPPAASPQQQAVTAAEQTAKRTGKATSVDSMTSETQTVTADPHGGLDVKLSPAPVRTKQNGRWVPIDTMLHRDANGTLAPAATAYGTVRFSGGGTGPLVTTTSGTTAYTLSWPTALPAPTVSGTTATYPNVLPGVDLELSATTTGGFTDVLVVHTADAAKNPALAGLNLAAHTTGGTLDPHQDGTFTVTGHNGMTLAAATPMMWDSATAPTPKAGQQAQAQAAPQVPDPSDARHAGLSAHVAPVAMHTTGSTLSLAPDKALLTASTTDFPVYIDPTATWYDYGGGSLGFDEVKQGGPCNGVPLFDRTDPNADGGALGVGYNGWNEGCNGKEHTYYQWSLPSELNGATVQAATVNATKVFGSACQATTVNLTWTGGIGGGTDWNNAPGAVSPRYETQAPFTEVNCNNKGWSSNGFDVTRPIQWSAQVGAPQFTVELTEDAAEAGFNKFQFSRFSSTAALFKGVVPTLDIKLDRPPSVPGGLSARSGADNVGCATGQPYPYLGKTIATHTPVLNATVSDPDAGGLQANFKYWVDGSSTVATGTSADGLAPGTDAQFSLPPSFTSSLTNGQIVDWQAQTNDGILTSGWSSVCHFIAEPVAPNEPSAVSADGVYPNVATGGQAGAHAGVPGQFTFSANGVGTTQFVYGLDQQPSPTNPDPSQIVSTFTGGTVAGGLTHHWPLADTSDPAGNKPLTLASGASIASDPTRGNVLTLNGTSGYATTSGPVIDTTNSYTVSAWVKLANTNGFATIVSQGDTNASSFYLQYSHTDNAWSFVSPSQNATTPSSFPRVLASSPPTLNTWTHLVGVFDSGSDTMSLYVNGDLAGSATNPSPWGSTGQLAIGGVKLVGGGAGDFFPGSISDVQIYSRAMTATEVSSVHNGTIPSGTMTDRWTIGDGTGGTLADPAGNHPATLTGTTAWTNDTQRGNVLDFDGTSGYATTSGPILNTTNGYSVSAWVKLDNTDDFATIVSQGDSNAASFYLQYSHALNAWSFVSPSSNDVNPASYPSAHASSPPTLDTWTHLVGTYDAGSHQMALYVDGALAATGTNPTAWNSTGQLAIGAVKQTGGGVGNFFPGQISDVQTYSRTLTASEVNSLYTTATVRITPPSPGLHRLYVYSRDGAGDDSGYTTYPFLVSADPATTCASLSACFDNTAITSDSQPSIGSYAQTGTGVVDTTGSYSVSAWVKLDHLGDYYTAVSAGGKQSSAFYLQYSAQLNAWTFVSPSADAVNPAGYPNAHAGTSPALNAWTHLVGVFDVGSHTMSLYVNGRLAGTGTNPTPWAATGGLAIGAATDSLNDSNYFPGSISDVQVYSRPLTAADVAVVYGGNTASGVVGRWRLTDGSGTTAADSAGSHPAALSGGALWAADPNRTEALELAGATGADGENSFSAGDLVAAGWQPNKQVTIDGATFTLPNFGSGQNDNVLAANQTVLWSDKTPVAANHAEQLEFLATATNADTAQLETPATQQAAALATAPAIPDGTAVSGVYCFDATNPDNYCPAVGRINFADGTSRTFYLDVPDWITGPSSLAAVTLPHENQVGGHVSYPNGPKLYTFSVPFLPSDAGRKIASVTLPDVSPKELSGGEALHVFGMTTRNTTQVAGAAAGQSWTGAWASPTEGAYNYQGGAFANQSFRVVVKPSVSGGQVRIKLDNALGSTPLDIDKVTVSAGTATTSPNLTGKLSQPTFGGQTSTVIPAGGMVYTDPLTFPVTSGKNVVVSFWLANGSDTHHDPVVPYLVEHTWSNTAWEYVSPPNTGDQTAQPGGAAYTGTNGAFTNLVTDVDVVTPTGTVATTAVLGDGLVDPWQSGADALVGNDIAAELTAAEPTAPTPYGTLDEGIEANQILTDNPETHNGGPVGGPSALSRVDRDILDQPGITTVVVDEGIEDLLAGHTSGALDPGDTLARVGYQKLLNFLQTYGINVIGVPLAPCDGYAGGNAPPSDPCTAAVEASRQVANGWLADSPLGMGPWPIPGVARYFYTDTDGAVGVPDADGLTGLDPHAAMPDHANLTASGYGALTSAYLGPQDHWRLDDGATNPADPTQATDTAINTTNPDLVTNLLAAENDATLVGGATFVTDPTRTEALRLDGTSGAATTGGTVLDTTKSFSVSAWVDPTSLPATDAAVISEDGANTSAFALRYDATHQRWAFGMSASDTAGAATIQATSQFAPAVNTWTHLVGTYNANTGALTLYVNGAVAGTATDTTPFAASGVLAMGRGRSGGAPSEWFPGLLSDVEAWNYSVTPDEIAARYQQIH